MNSGISCTRKSAPSQLAEGPRSGTRISPAPAGFIISSTRSDFLAGPRADWWRDRETILDRARMNKPTRTGVIHSVLPTAFPSWQGQSVIPELAGTSGASSSSPPTVEEKPWNPRKQKRDKPKPKPDGKGKGKAKGHGVLDVRIYETSAEGLPSVPEATASLQSSSGAKEAKEAEEGFKEMKGSERPSLPNLSVGRYRTFAPFWFLHEFL